jgi:hypothetical protein
MKEFPDARLHFAHKSSKLPTYNRNLYCRKRRVHVKKLSRAAINNPDLVQVDMHEKSRRLRFFDWKTDFTKKQDLTTFLNQYREKHDS